MSHWDKHAKQWHTIGTPLRPSHSDVGIIHSWSQVMSISQTQPFNVLLLGATPELAAISWPNTTRLFAIDSNFAMIKSVLLKTKLSVSPLIIQGNWLHLPLPESFFHLVVGDGCYSMVAEKNYDQLSDEMFRVLHPTGFFFMRFFIKPDPHESMEIIHQDFVSGKIDNFHSLKWRIAMALQDSLKKGVCLDTIWQTWNKRFKEHSTLYWPQQVISSIDNYKNNPALYTFPTYGEMSAKLNSRFTTLDLHTPSYQLGERCPILKLKPLK